MQIPKGTEDSKFAADMRRLQVAMASITPTSEGFAKAVKQLNEALSKNKEITNVS